MPGLTCGLPDAESYSHDPCYSAGLSCAGVILVEDLPWHLTPPTLCSSLSCSGVLHFRRSSPARYISCAHCFPRLSNLQSERGDGLSCRGPGALLSRGPFPPHAGAPGTIWADSVSPHLLQGEAKLGGSRGTQGRSGPASQSSHVHLGKTPELQVLSVRVPAAQEVPAVCLVRDVASWRPSTSAPTSDLDSRCGDASTGAPRHVPLLPALLLGTRSPLFWHPGSLFRLARAIPFWSAPRLVDLCPLCHRCARSRRLQHAFQGMGF